MQTLTATVTVDAKGHLTPTSAVTIGGTEIPVPQRCPDHGWVLWWHCVAETLREHGWKVVRPQEEVQRITPTLYEIRVERIER